MTFQGYNISTSTYPGENLLTVVIPVFDTTLVDVLITSSSVDLDWGALTTMVVIDYEVQFKLSSASTWTTFVDPVTATTGASVTGLTDNTSYDFRVRGFDGTAVSEWSNILTVTTFVNVPFFGTDNTFLNVSGAGASVVAAYENGTTVNRNGVFLTTLNQGQTFAFTAAANDLIESPQKILVSGTGAGGTRAWPSRLSAGKEFLIGSIRNDPQTVNFFAFEATTIDLIAGTTVLDTASVGANTAGTLSGNFIGNLRVSSTGLVICYFTSNGGVDARLMVPSSNEVIGFPSTRANLSSSNTLGSDIMAVTHSNSVVNAFVCNSGNFPQITPQGTTSLYQCESTLVQGVDGVEFACQSFADSNGAASAMYLPTSLMRQEFIIPAASDYIAFASTQAGTIDVLNAAGTTLTTLTLTRTGTDPNAPYRAREGGRPIGTRYAATVPVAAWWQEAATDDETLLLGVD